MASEPVKRLYRSRTNRMLAGVCGGLADYLGADPAIIRLAWVVFCLMGPGLLLYILAIFIVPLEPEKKK